MMTCEATRSIFWPARVSAVIACCFLGLLQVPNVDSNALLAQESSRQAAHGGFNTSTMSALTDLAIQALTDTNFLAKPRFSIDQKNRTFFYNVDPKPLGLILTSNDPFAALLEALIRVRVFQRDFKENVPDERFWIQPLTSIERQIDQCANDPSMENLPASSPSRSACSRDIENSFDVLTRAVHTYAEQHNLNEMPYFQAKDPVEGYRVVIKIDPPKARVRVMTLLEYKKYQYLNTPKEKYQWNDLLASDNDMIGWYHYRAEWPAELNGPEEGDFEVKKPSTITFKPSSK